jgi:hypothetical protein
MTWWGVREYNHAHRGASDWDLLRIGGRILFHLDPRYPINPLRLYARIHYQLGPPPLFVIGLAQRLLSPRVGYGGDVAVLVLTLALGVASLAIVELLARELWSPRRAAAATTVAGALLLPSWGAGMAAWAHLEDAMALAGICLAILLARRNHAVACGIVIGLAAASKPWAVIFVPMILMFPETRARLRALIAAVGAIELCWAPFIIAAPSTVVSTQLPLRIYNESALRALGFPAGAAAPGWIRLAQFLLGMLAVGLVARRSWWSILWVGMAARLIVDPLAWPYYSVGPMLGAAMMDVHRGRRIPICSIATGVVFYLPYITETGAGYLRFAWCAVILVVAIARMRGETERVSGGLIGADLGSNAPVELAPVGT